MVVPPTYTPSRRFVGLIHLLPRLAAPLLILMLLVTGLIASRSDHTPTATAPTPILLALLNAR